MPRSVSSPVEHAAGPRSGLPEELRRAMRHAARWSWGAAVVLSLMPCSGAVAQAAAQESVPSGLVAPDTGRADRAAATRTAPGAAEGAVGPVLSVAPRTMFQRRGPRGMRGPTPAYAPHTVWLTSSLHGLAPAPIAQVWPQGLRLGVGRRQLGAPQQAAYIIGLDFDAAHLPGTHPAWRRMKRALHYVRLPGPAVIATPQGVRAVGLYW